MPRSLSLRTAPTLPLIALVFAGSPATSTAEDCRPGGEEATAAAREMSKALQEAAEIPGLAVAVGRGGELVWSDGFGLADLETPAPATPRTRFRAASVSKVLTAAVLAHLAARGTVDLDAPIGTHLPDLPPALEAVTLRQLAGHLGGIRHYGREDFVPSPIDHRHFDSLADSLELFAGDELVAAPGSEYRYSTFGYTLLGAVLEAAAGRSFPVLLEEEVVRPLGLAGTGIDHPRQILPGRASFYERTREGELVRAEYVDPSYKWPGGGLLTTPEDLVHFGLAHLGDGYVAAGWRKQLFTPQTTSAGESTGVGLGWRIGEDWRGRRIFHHSGSMAGARTSLLLYPDHDLAIALMSNLGTTPILVETTLQMLAEPFFGGDCGEGAAAPAGVFRVAARFDGAPGEGLLLLERRGGGTSGLLTVPEPVAAALSAGGTPSPTALRIVRTARGPEGPALVVAWPLGLLPLAVEPTADGTLTGRLEALGRVLEVVATPLAGGEPEANRGESEAPPPS
ncbi:MAG TPA: serine hydrolase domain-containing protein [Thermoanaerobaculia bacterium]|nr:serine hydrolase domain-containing protein [Thermoanaerobaculia bacterium]